MYSAQQHIKSMNPVHWRILRLALKGLKNVQIAEHVQMTPIQISRIVNSPIFKSEIEKKREQLNNEAVIQQNRYEDEAIQQLKQQTLNAVQRITQGMKSDNEAIAIRSAESILDRTGISKITKNETQYSGDPMITINHETLALIKQTLELDKDEN